MRTINKYPLFGSQTLHTIPSKFKILHVAVDFNTPCVWIEFDALSPYVIVKFTTIPTGYNVSDNEGDYAGTYILFEGAPVTHVYAMVL